jgi:N-acetylmuramoyl-L-alanine amidase
MRPEEIVIHHSATHDGPENNTAGIRKWHVGHNGWDAIGYHALTEYVGNGYEILIGRPWDQAGAHCLGHNQTALGFCFVGDFNKIMPPVDQLKTGAAVVAYWMRTHGIPLGKIYRHDTLNETDCPGKFFNLTAFLNLVQEAL